MFADQITAIDINYRKSGYFCCRLIFSNFAGQLDSQKYFSYKNKSTYDLKEYLFSF